MNVNKFRIWVSVALVTAVSLLAFYYYSLFDDKVIGVLTDPENIISKFIPGFNWVLLIKLIIMGATVRLAYKSVEFMRLGVRRSKLHLNEIKKIAIIKENKYFNLSNQNDNEQLSSYLNSLKQKNKSSKPHIMESNNVVIEIINSLLKTKNVLSAKSTADFNLSLFESSVNSDFSQAKLAQAALPLLGFAGTILGIMVAMSGLGPALSEIDAAAKAMAIEEVIGQLAVAFDTTLLAVICALIVRYIERKLQIKLNENLKDREKVLESCLFSNITE